MIERLDVPPKQSRVLWALKDGPLSAREIETKLRMNVFETWAEDEGGFEIEWGDPDGSRGPNEPVGARLCAIASANRRGIPHVGSGQALRLLYWLEREGHVARIQLEGHRPILWRLA